jgi:enamine deaminase RidA (YjgF/YER057c/UK114 family)
MNNVREKSSARSKDVYPIGKKNPNLPFHPAVRAGDYIFVSGQVAKDADGNMISGTIEVETKGTIEAIARILAEEGATLADVVRVTTYLDDVRDFGRYNKVFGEFFKDAVLARTTVEARAVINTKVEMDAIVYKPKRP